MLLCGPWYAVLCYIVAMLPTDTFTSHLPCRYTKAMPSLRAYTLFPIPIPRSFSTPIPSSSRLRPRLLPVRSCVLSCAIADALTCLLAYC